MGRFAGRLAIALMIVALSWQPAPAAPNPQRSALVLYTQVPGQSYGNAGRLYAMLLANLLGHFPIAVTIKDAQRYQAGEGTRADAVFFLGVVESGVRLPPALLRELAARQGPTVWFGAQYGELLDAARARGRDLGVTHLGPRGYDTPPSAQNPRPGFYDTVEYKGLRFAKYFAFDAAGAGAVGDPALGFVQVAAPARTVVEIVNGKTGKRAPYVVRNGRSWYVADLPFTYTGPRDRYLVLADLLFDMLELPPSNPNHRALVRLEDVHPLTQPQAIDRLSSYFAERKVPFSVALIPYYKDPFGKAWINRPQDVSLADARAAELVAALKRALSRGGAIVQHGTTHQFERMANPNFAISGDDFEFWDIVNMRPIAALESDKALAERLEQGRALMTRMGLAPFAFEAPHYRASPRAYRTIAKLYPATYQRVAYYSHDDGRLNDTDARAEATDGQFFPYAVRRDVYGQRVIPENLGNLQYAAPVQSADDLLRNADYAKTVRGGFASFFFHPFFLEGAEADKAMRDLDRIVTGLQQRGFRFVAAPDVARELER
jgi:uncharacterized protein YdaL